MNSIDSYGQISLPANGIINAIAGTGTAGYSGDGGLATSATLRYPYAIAVDSSGNVYIADTQNQVLRKILASTGDISTVAGTTVAGYSGDGGAATSAKLNTPSGLAIDKTGNIYIADSGNHRIRMITLSTGVISTVAGNGTQGFSGDGGLAQNAELNAPAGVAVDSSGNIYIADSNNQRVRMVSSGVISTLAGNGSAGYSGDGYPATHLELNGPISLAVDASQNIYVVDSGNNRIRKLVATAGDGSISTIAGNGTSGYSGDGGLATSAELKSPDGVAVDIAGNIYIGDELNSRVRKITASTGNISTVAGNGTIGNTGNGGIATSAELRYPNGVALDLSGNLYILDGFSNLARAVGATSTPMTASCSPNPATQGAGTTCTAKIGGTNPTGTIAWTINGTAWRTDTLSGNSDAISGLTTENTGTYTITATYSGDTHHPSGAASTSLSIKLAQTITFTAPASPVTYGVAPITLSATGGASGNAVYFIIVSGPGTISGSTLTITGPGTVVVGANQAGNATYLNAPQVTRTVAVNYALPPKGVITTIAGNGTAGDTGDGALAANAELNSPFSTAVDASGNIYVADANNQAIRRIVPTTGYISTVASPGYGGTGVALDTSGNFYIADGGANIALLGLASNNALYIVAGNQTAGYSGDGAVATSAEINSPQGVAVDSSGNIYIADTGNNRIRKVLASNDFISTIVGTGVSGYAGNGGSATAAKLNTPFNLALDSAGNIYIADTYNNCIRKVTVSTGVITTVAGNNVGGFSGDGGAATSAEINLPTGVAIDSSGNIYIADYGNNRIRLVTVSTGVISTVVGTGVAGYSGDGGVATSARLNAPAGVSLDSSRNIYISDATNNRVRVVGHK